MIKIHKIETEKKEENIFSAGLAGWGVLFSKFKRQQPEEFKNQPQAQPQRPNALALPKKEGWSI